MTTGGKKQELGEEGCQEDEKANGDDAWWPGRLYAGWWPAPIAMRGRRAVKVTPWMRGSFHADEAPMPTDWMMVAMPQVSRSALRGE